MTAIVGVICKDGIVIGSDSATTFTSGDQKTIEQPSRKIYIPINNIISAGTGSVGLLQRFNAIIETNWSKFVNHKSVEIAQAICAMAITNFRATGLNFPFQYGALLAFYHLYKVYFVITHIVCIFAKIKNTNIWGEKYYKLRDIVQIK